MQPKLPADLIFDITMFYGKTGMRQFKLLVGKKGDHSQRFHRLSGWFESILGDYFEKIGFDPERYEDCQMGYPSLVDVIGKHKSVKPIVVPMILEFKNSKGLGPAMRKLRHSARRSGVGFQGVR